MTPQEQLEARRLVQDPQESVYDAEGKHSIEPLIVMAKHKVLILGTTVGAALLSIVIALLFRNISRLKPSCCRRSNRSRWPLP